MTDSRLVFGRRRFLTLSGAAAVAPYLAPLSSPSQLPPASDPTHLLRICKARVELAPGHLVTTTTYDGRLPGPLLRATVGRRTIIDICNETDTPERIQWHGQNATAIGGLGVPAYSRRRAEFTPTRPGLYFYHSNRIAAASLAAGLYSGQVGAVLVEPEFAGERGCRESVVVLKGYEPYFFRSARGCEVTDGAITINGRLPGHEIPAQWGPGERVLLHVLNAGATDPYTLELPGYSFEVVALDGNPVPSPGRVARLHLSPGERVSAVAVLNGPTMDGPAMLGRAGPFYRPVRWSVQAGDPDIWDYTRFGHMTANGPVREPDAVLDVVLTRRDAARSGFNQWLINGARFSMTRALFRLERGLRYRLRIHNTSDEAIPVHLQRHLLEIVRWDGRRTSGIFKDVVTAGPRQELEVDLVADSPGPALLHCTRQLHRDFGLMALIDYA